jgi:5-methylcytosine-specific restriction endonuclease McrA
MSEITCSVDECPATHVEARGLCRKHYARWRRGGTVELRGHAKSTLGAESCAIDGCDRPRRNLTTGWCRTHHDRWKRTGATGPVFIETRLRPADTCLIVDCDAKPKSRGWCGKHYVRFRTHGDPTVTTGRERSGGRSCSRCFRTPEDVEFRKDKRAPDGLGAYCKPCEKEYNAAYYLEHREVLNAMNNARYTANSERYLAGQRAYRLTNIDRIRERERQYRRGNPICLARAKRWREANRERARSAVRNWHRANQDRQREYQRQWRAANRERVRERAANWCALRSARKRNAEGKIEWINRKEIWKRDRGICGLCALPVPWQDMHLDHFIPLDKGGSHTKSNVHTTHSRCNLSKGSREVPKWGFATIDVPAPRAPTLSGALMLF